MPLSESRRCEYRLCRAELDPSRQSNTHYCDSSCRSAEARLRAEEKKTRPGPGKRRDTTYAVLAQEPSDDGIQRFRLAGLTAAHSREEAAEKIREYANGDDLVPVPTRSFMPV